MKRYNRTMTRLVLFVVALALGLAACTGTRSNRAPTLLIVGYSEAAQGSLAVIEDTFLTEDAVLGRFLFLGATPLLGGVPVGYDVSDRAGGRDELVVLSREGDTEAAYLSVYPIDNLNPDPEALQLEASLERPYSELALPGGLSAIDICPTLVQATFGGRFAAVLHDLSLCNSANLNEAIDIIDLDATPPAIVRRIETSSIVPSAMYLYQSGGADQLFYFTDEAGGARLRGLSIPGLEERSTGVLIADSFKNEPSVVQDLREIGGELIALQSSRFTPIEAFTSGNATVGEAVTTTSGSTQLVPTNSPSPTAVMILGQNTFTVHSSSEDANPATTQLNAVVDGSLEPVGGFVYFVADAANNLPIFDLREYDPELRDLSANLGTSFGVPQLSNPAFVTWAQSVLPPEESGE